MALTFEAVTCAAGQYTRLAYSSASVAFKLRTATTGKLWGGQVPDGEDAEVWLPDPGLVDFVTVEGTRPYAYNDLWLGDGLWFMPDGIDDVVVEVNRS